MSRLRILNKIPLVIKRPLEEGYYQGGKWFESVDGSFDIRCSIQPFRLGNTQTVLPEGVTANDAVFVFTQTEIRTVNQFSLTEADTTEIDSREYVAFNVENWSRHSGLTPNHFKVVFIRKDKLTKGKL